MPPPPLPFLSTHAQVRLIVVDSIASPFRHGFEDMGLRNRLLSGMAQNFIKLATQFNIAVGFEVCIHILLANLRYIYLCVCVCL